MADQGTSVRHVLGTILDHARGIAVLIAISTGALVVGVVMGGVGARLL